MATQLEDVGFEADDQKPDTQTEAESPANEASEGAENDEGESEELHLLIEGEEIADDTPLIRKLRDNLRAANGRITELERSRQPERVEVGKKPDLWEDCDGDPDKFEAALTDYHDRRSRASRLEETQTAQQHAQARAQEQRLAKHRQRAAALRIPDFESKEKAVIDALGEGFAGLALGIAEDSAKLVGALGANPIALQKLADEPDPMERIKLLKRMESKIVTNGGRKKPPAPEAGTIQRGTAPAAMPSGDKKLEQLRTQAQKTGDYSAVVAYRNDQKSARK